VEQARHRVRDAIFERVADRRLAGVLAALVVGDQGAIERADWDVFRATGVAHLMSISGLHVTMFAWAAALLVGALWRRSSRLCLAWPAQHAALAGGVLLATAYAAFSGWGVPAQRTIWMLATVALLRLGGRHWPWPWVWLLACAVVVLLDPWALTQAGFWLSFVAVGVLFATGSGPAPDTVPTLRTRLASLLREQWVVTLALTPLSLLLFGQVSLVGLLANLLAIPWVTLLVTPLAMAACCLPWLWDGAAWAVALLAWLLEAWPRCRWRRCSGGGAALGRRRRRGRRCPAGDAAALELARAGLPLLLPVLLWQAPRPAAGEFELVAADVGQGNAVLVRTAAHTLVYDAGPRYSQESDAGHRCWCRCCARWASGSTRWSSATVTPTTPVAPPAVLTMQPEANLLSSIEDQHELQALRRATRCEAGQRWQWDGVTFEVLHPTAADFEAAAKPNAVSCVLRISNVRQAALLAGDIERAQEARLAAQPEAVRADLLLVPHHGSKTSSSDLWLDAVQPRLALVQAGYRNRFGHPAAPVLERYAQRGIVVVESPRCGAARWESAAPQQVACEREQAGDIGTIAYPEAATVSVGLELAILCASEKAPCTNLTRCSRCCPRAARSSSSRSRWAGRASPRCRACARTTAPMPSGWRASRRR
jgi:competence protein ComEC